MDLRKLGAKQTMEMKMLHWILEAVACVAVLLRGGLGLPTFFDLVRLMLYASVMSPCFLHHTPVLGHALDVCSLLTTWRSL